MKKLISQIAIILITFYRAAISPLFPPSCRFTPTCSEYALQAFKTHPLHKAFWLSLKRILKCHPWGGYGYDPVPEPKRKNYNKNKNDYIKN